MAIPLPKDGSSALPTNTDLLEPQLPIRHYRSQPADLCPHCRNQRNDLQPMQSSITPFAGRLGGNQEFIVDRTDPANHELIEQIPDAAPGIPIKELFDLRGFRQVELWKAAMMEGVGSLIIVYTTAWIALSPDVPPEPPNSPAAVFATAAFFGPLASTLSRQIIDKDSFCFHSLVSFVASITISLPGARLLPANEPLLCKLYLSSYSQEASFSSRKRYTIHHV